MGASSRRGGAPANTIDKTLIMENCIFIFHQRRHFKIPFEDILYIQSSSNYSVVHTAEKKFTVSKTLLELENRGMPSFMKRIHRSYIVNILHMESFDADYIYLRGSPIPLSKSRWKDALAELIVW